jgi:predicted ATPase/class 3 adenylate cyclase
MLPGDPTLEATVPERPAPTGVVSLLFTDIEGSTRRWERVPDAMADAVLRHDRLVRAALESHAGYVFKTIGDAFCAAFSRAEDAAAAAIAAQRVLAGEDFSAVDGLRVRIGIHTGRTHERDGDYFGTTVNRVARLLAIAHGGQIVVSSVAADLLLQAGWPAPRLRDLGVHRLKDLTTLENVFQIVDPSLPVDFPPLRSLGVLSHNLPAQSTSFVGRQREIEEIAALFERSRLVTLVGSGGVGKTRTALQIGASMAAGSGQGVWFVELASASPASSIPLAVATAANLHVDLERGGEERFYEALSATTKLLILDNCEHLVRPAADFAGAVLRKCPKVTVLCTSRERLGVRGEALFRMPSLAVPEAHELPKLTAERAMEFEAIALFVNRARTRDGRFALGGDTPAIVAEICRRLDGIPLAIELASARTGVLTPAQLRDRLHDRFRLLSYGGDNALPRQQTLRSLIDWSYDLLDETEKLALRRLSVFAGSFTLDAAERVVADGALEPDAVLDVLSRLVDKSLVAVDLEGEETARYRLIESIHAYAAERFAGDADAATPRRLAEWTLELMHAAHAAWATEPSDRWDRRYAAELENVRAVLRWALNERCDVRLGVAVTAAAARFWGRIAPSEGVPWIELARDVVDVETSARRRADLAFAEANVRVALQDYSRALEAAREALSLLAESGADELVLADARRFAGFSLGRLGRHDEAIQLLSDVADTVRRSGQMQLIAYAAQDLAIAQFGAGNLDAARRLFDEALSAFRAAGNERGIAATTINLAELTYHGGDPAGAIRIMSGANVTAAGGISPAHVAANLAAYHSALEQWDEARRLVRRAFDVADPLDPILPDVVQHAVAIALFADVETRPKRNVTTAAQLLGFVDRLLARVRDPNELRQFVKIQETLAHILPDDERQRLQEEGATWDFERGMYEVRTLWA